MNYEKIYNSLIQKRLVNKIDRSVCYCEQHHIKPKSIYPELENEQSNIIALTLREHFFAHLLLQQIYKIKYGKNSIQYKKMLSAIRYMLDTRKYKTKTSRLYEKIRTAASVTDTVDKLMRGTTLEGVIGGLTKTSSTDED